MTKNKPQLYDTIREKIEFLKFTPGNFSPPPEKIIEYSSNCMIQFIKLLDILGTPENLPGKFPEPPPPPRNFLRDEINVYYRNCMYYVQFIE